MSNRQLTFVLAASDHGPLIVSRTDFNRGPTGAYYGVGYQILATAGYERNELQEIFELINGQISANGPGAVVLDVGANIGVFTVEVAKQFGPKLVNRVVAFEAQERIYYALAGNIALNNVMNAEAVFAAVSDSSGMMAVPSPDYDKPGSYGSLELQFSERTENIGQPISYNKRFLKPVRMVDIDWYGFERVDFIKLDVEGMEIQALKGARQTMVKCRPVLLIEWIKAGFDELEKYLDDVGYDVAVSGMNVVARPR